MAYTTTKDAPMCEELSARWTRGIHFWATKIFWYFLKKKVVRFLLTTFFSKKKKKKVNKQPKC